MALFDHASQMWDWLVGTDREPGGPVIFIHIPKSAGSTLNQVLKRQYDASDTYEIDPEGQAENLQRFKQLPAEQRDRLKLLRGHFGFGLHEYFSRPATYITILRDPVDRVISHYYYLRRLIRDGAALTQRPWLREAATMDLREYVLHASSADPRNGQTKLLAGRMQGWDPDDEPAGNDAQLLEVAKRNLRERVAVVGLTERFDETLLLLRRQLGWRPPFYVSKNVTRARPPRERLPADVIETIEHANLLDRELYRYGEQLFEAAIAAQSAAFQRELSWFRFANSRYHDLVRVQRSLRYRARMLGLRGDQQ